MGNDTLIERLLATIDTRDANAFAGFLTSDASFRFGNHPAVLGREAIDGDCRGISSKRSEVSAIVSKINGHCPMWSICTGLVTYTRHDGSTLQVPFANVLKLRRDAIYDYRIFVDNSALFPGLNRRPRVLPLINRAADRARTATSVTWIITTLRPM